jgi:hypothetical protein
MFYVSLDNIHDVAIENLESWSYNKVFANENFEAFINTQPTFSHLKGKPFHVWDANHYFQAWLPYVNDVHPNDESWHACPTTWVINAETRNQWYLKTLMDSVNM